MKIPNRPEPEPLMSIDQLAAYLNVAKSWIYSQTRMRKHNGFPVVKVGKYCRFDRKAVAEWLDEQGE